MIDDISVIVLELGSLEPEPPEMPPAVECRKTVGFNSIAVPSEETDVSVGVMRGDIIRGSFIPAKDPKEKKSRFDPKRGSYANKEDNLSDEGGDHSDRECNDEELEGIPYAGEPLKN